MMQAGILRASRHAGCRHAGHSHADRLAVLMLTQCAMRHMHAHDAVYTCSTAWGSLSALRCTKQLLGL